MERRETVRRTAGEKTNAPGRTLVVLDPDQPGETLRAALGLPGFAAEEPDLLLVYSDAEYERRLGAQHQVGYRGPFSVAQLSETAQTAADRAGREWLSDEYGAAYGDVGRVAHCVAHAVDERGYTRVYAPRPRRTLLSRLLRWPPSGRLERALSPGVELLTVPDGAVVEPGEVIEAEPRPVDE